MNDVKWIKYENCEIFKVYQELPLFTHHYNIIISKRKESSIFPEYCEVGIDDRELFEELIKLKENKKNRCQFACGMADIDIYKANEKYVIHNSPSAGIHIQYVISENDFNKLINALNPELLDLYLKKG